MRRQSSRHKSFHGTVHAVLLVLALGHLAAPFVTEAQPARKSYRVGILCPITCAGADVAAFRERLGTLGYKEGSTIAFELRSAEGKVDRLPDLATDLVRLNVDLIFTTWGTAPGLAAKRATSSIPIVVGSVGDPVAAGLVASLNRPGGNVTGFSSLALDLEAKRLEILKQVVPAVSRIAVFWDSTNPYSVLAIKQERAAARRLGVKLREIQVGDVRDLDRAFATIVSERLEALSIHGYVPVLAGRDRIVELAAKNRVAAIYPLREFVSAGGLLSYGASVTEIAARAAAYVDKIFRGASPADLPVEQPTKVELVINTRTANALGLTLPPSLLVRADHVIE